MDRLTGMRNDPSVARQKKSQKRKRATRRLYPGSPQMDGYRFEEHVAFKLRLAGYIGVDVTPKSGDYGADIIAYSPKTWFSSAKKVCFQCKRYSRPVGVKAVQEIIGAMVYYRCHVGCVVSASGFTESSKKLAASAGVVLMDVNGIRMV